MKTKHSPPPRWLTSCEQDSGHADVVVGGSRDLRCFCYRYLNRAATPVQSGIALQLCSTYIVGIIEGDWWRMGIFYQVTYLIQLTEVRVGPIGPYRLFLTVNINCIAIANNRSRMWIFLRVESVAMPSSCSYEAGAASCWELGGGC